MSERSEPEQRVELWFLITALCIGGAERTLVDLANEVAADGYDVTVWTIFDSNPLAAELDAAIDVRSLTSSGRVEDGAVVGVTNPLAYVLAPARFLYAAATERPDLVQSFLFFDNLLARLAGVVSPARIVTGVRSVPNDPHTVRAAADRLTIRLSDRVVSNSRNGATLAIDRGASVDDVSVIPNGRHLETYSTARPDPVRSELDVGEDELVVGTVGRLLERKGHFELVTAWSRVVNLEPNARLLFVGDGQDRAAIEAHAEELGCAGSIEFLGNRGDVPALLAAIDVFAFPSHFEGLPGAVIEAMAAGLPIVATPVDGTAELLDEYRTGLFVPVDAPEPLAWAIYRLLQTPDLRDRLGASARDEARQHYTVDSMVSSFEALYRDVLDAAAECPPQQRVATATSQ